MKLYTVPLAPNPMRVTLYLAERREAGADIALEQVIVNTLKGRQREPEHLARNRFGTLPVLELDSGTFLTESLSIIDYFEAAFPERRLSAADPERYAMERNIERTLEMRITYDLGWWVHFTKSPLNTAPNPEKAAELKARMQAGFDYAESLLEDDRSFLTGGSANIADCTLAAFLQFMRFTGEDLIEDRALLREWDERYRSRPHVSDLFMV
jgi:glutathione S-transferase